MNKQRRCVGCGEFKPRENLIRVMKNENGGEIVINLKHLADLHIFVIIRVV